MEQILELLKNYAVTYGMRLIAALATLFLGLKLINLITKRIPEKPLFKKADPSAVGFLKGLTSIVLKALIFITAIGILGIPMTSVITILGTALFAVGLALQGSLSHFAGGFMILLFKPFKVGDYIDNHTDSGTVLDIGVFYTKLSTIDKKIITIPNSLLSNASVVNYSASETRSVNFEIAVSYDTDIDKAKEVLSLLAARQTHALSDPPPFVAVKSHGEYALIFVLRIWCKSEHYWTIYFEMMENIKKAFDQTGIEIPIKSIGVYQR
ncbi:MAG: mechanosensitive ion channel domain-containing protein [Eubacteriales bacterium]